MLILNAEPSLQNEEKDRAIRGQPDRIWKQLNRDPPLNPQTRNPRTPNSQPATPDRLLASTIAGLAHPIDHLLCTPRLILLSLS